MSCLAWSEADDEEGAWELIIIALLFKAPDDIRHGASVDTLDDNLAGTHGHDNCFIDLGVKRQSEATVEFV